MLSGGGHTLLSSRKGDDWSESSSDKGKGFCGAEPFPTELRGGKGRILLGFNQYFWGRRRYSIRNFLQPFVVEVEVFKLGFSFSFSL